MAHSMPFTIIPTCFGAAKTVQRVVNDIGEWWCTKPPDALDLTEAPRRGGVRLGGQGEQDAPLGRGQALAGVKPRGPVPLRGIQLIRGGRRRDPRRRRRRRVRAVVGRGPRAQEPLQPQEEDAQRRADGVVPKARFHYFTDLRELPRSRVDAGESPEDTMGGELRLLGGGMKEILDPLLGRRGTEDNTGEATGCYHG